MARVMALPNPPCRVRSEFITPLIFELIHCLHNADITLLDQIQELRSPIQVSPGDGDDSLNHLTRPFAITASLENLICELLYPSESYKKP